jgi:hypothetical protein
MQFPGGELEGRKTAVLCPKCQDDRCRPTLPSPTLCFQCYRLGLERDRALLAAANFEAATSERFQESLPFEAVNRARLTRLRSERSAERRRQASAEDVHRFVDRRRRAQIEARHALDRIAHGLSVRPELQFPESWLPFVVGRRA